ncbi:Uncharacterised protein [Mycobacteroides abscessus subsp. abscessus]|nr:Uncharacterised protein [Mycobacteroides abscessus subsp. abscessus]
MGEGAHEADDAGLGGDQLGVVLGAAGASQHHDAPGGAQAAQRRTDAQGDLLQLAGVGHGSEVGDDRAVGGAGAGVPVHLEVPGQQTPGQRIRRGAADDQNAGVGQQRRAGLVAAQGGGSGQAEGFGQLLADRGVDQLGVGVLHGLSSPPGAWVVRP